MKNNFKLLFVFMTLHLFIIDARTIKIVIASKSPQKVAAIKASFNDKFLDDHPVYYLHATDSGIPEQPVGADSAMQGIRNRLRSLPDNTEADYIISIENYIEQCSTDKSWHDKGLIVVQQGLQETIMETKPILIPDIYVDLARQMSDKTSEHGYTTTVGKAIQQAFPDRIVAPSNWHQEPEFGSVSRQQLLQDALDKVLNAQDLKILKSFVLTYPDFPKPGITFASFLPITQDAQAFQLMIDLLGRRYETKNIDVIVGLESRGFIIGAALAYKLGVSFVPIRKPGKLPGPIYSVDYQKEYGFDTLVIAQDALQPGQRVLIIDDLIATGGSARAAIKLVHLAGGKAVEFASLLKIAELEQFAVLPIPSFNLID